MPSHQSANFQDLRSALPWVFSLELCGVQTMESDAGALWVTLPEATDPIVTKGGEYWSIERGIQADAIVLRSPTATSWTVYGGGGWLIVNMQHMHM